MSTTDLRIWRPSGARASQLTADRRGPLTRIVVGSIVTGALTSAALVLGFFPGATEPVTTGLALLGFALGWTMLAMLSSRMTSLPQRWAYGLAAFLGTAGAGLLILAPGNEGLSRAAWVWPPALLALIAWSALRMRSSLPGRSKWLLYPVLGFLGAASLGAIAENAAMERESHAMTMPGRLFDVGGHRLHLDCRGSAAPTVVVENGLGENALLWTRISDATADKTRICSYDRAGTGWSDGARGSHDSLAIATDLHRLLDVAGEHGPFVLVGHSTGGIYAMTYAARYPEETAGMVLLDSASPQQFSILPDYASQYPMMMRLYGVMPTLERLGVGRLVPNVFANEVPGEAGRQAHTFSTSPRDARAARDEVATYRRAFAQAQGLTTLGSKPLIVISASETLAGTDGWAAAQRQLAALSDNSSYRTVRSSHGGLLDHGGSFEASVTAILDVVSSVRSGSDIRVH
jgi:pimeloyl-ACP methyl ester carboxylesterase